MPLDYEFVGVDAHKHFVRTIMELQPKLQQAMYDAANKYKNAGSMIITPEQEHEFKHAQTCRFCNGELNDDRVRDHCHYTGVYRGPAHKMCKLQASIHNLNEGPETKRNKQKETNIILF